MRLHVAHSSATVTYQEGRTGLRQCKAFVAAFDYQRLRQRLGGRAKPLFVAHRHVIHEQSKTVFRVVLGDATFGPNCTCVIAGAARITAGCAVVLGKLRGETYRRERARGRGATRSRVDAIARRDPVASLAAACAVLVWYELGTMLTAIVGFALAALGWIVLRRRARPSGGPSRDLQLREALRSLAEASGLRFEPSNTDGSCAVSGADAGVELRIEPGTRGMLFDGDLAIVASCPSKDRIVVWPREPPDEAIDGLGEERSTRDQVFDARFAVFSSSANMMNVVNDPITRSAIYDLGIVALVIRDDEAVLLLPGVPDSEALRSATALLARVVTGCQQLEIEQADAGAHDGEAEDGRFGADE